MSAPRNRASVLEGLGNSGDQRKTKYRNMNMSNLLRYVAIGSFALMIGAAPVQARAATSSATDGGQCRMDEFSAKKGGGGGGGKHAGGGHRGGGGGKHAGRPGGGRDRKSVV